ncbi:MAG TPA: hypothetical protein VMT73_06455 [Anaerolineales bacterium]|nr:hypothetical protein [Anaerolineales bacterium]
MTIREYLLSDAGTSRGAMFLKILFRIGIIASILWIAYFIFETITTPYPIEYREGVSQVMAQIFLKGGNPFTLEYQPLAMNNYGIVYDLVVYPFAALFGNTLAVHRSVTFLFLLSTFLLIFKRVSKDNKDLYFTLACSTIILISLTGRDGLGAFPSAAGVFLFLAATLIPFDRSFDDRGLLISALIGVIAYYTKPYFVLSFGIVASYVFLFISKKKGLLYTLVFALIFGVFYFFIRQVFSLYFIDTFLGNIVNATRSLGHLYAQLIELAKEFFPVIVLAFGFLFLRVNNLKSAHVSEESRPLVNILSFDQPWFSIQFDYYFYFLLCSTLAFVFVLGLHIGANMLYAYQLMVPPFCLWLFQKINPGTRLGLISIPLILLNFVLLVFVLLNPNFLSEKNSQEWARLYNYVNDSTHILNSPVITSAIVERGTLPVDSGQTEYYYRFDPYPHDKFLGPDYDIIKSNGRKYKDGIIDSVKNVKYDKVILSKGELLSDWKYAFVYGDLIQHYQLTDTFAVDMPQVDQKWTVEVWEPIRR